MAIFQQKIEKNGQERISISAFSLLKAKSGRESTVIFTFSLIFGAIWRFSDFGGANSMVTQMLTRGV